MEYLTVKQTAALLQVRDRTVRQYLCEKKLAGANLGSEGTGRRWRIPREAIDRFIKERLNDGGGAGAHDKYTQKKE